MGMCIDLDLEIPTILPEEEEDLESDLALEAGRENCGDPATDHIKNVQFNIDENNTATTDFDLDEELDYIALKMDLGFKFSVLPPVQFKVAAVPISWSPAWPVGHVQIKGYD